MVIDSAIICGITEINGVCSFSSALNSLFLHFYKRYIIYPCTEPPLRKWFSMFPLKARACRKQSCGEKQSKYTNQLSRVSFVPFGSLTYNQMKKEQFRLSCGQASYAVVPALQAKKIKLTSGMGLRVDRIVHVLSIELWNVFLWYWVSLPQTAKSRISVLYPWHTPLSPTNSELIQMIPREFLHFISGAFLHHFQLLSWRYNKKIYVWGDSDVVFHGKAELLLIYLFTYFLYIKKKSQRNA